MKEAFPNVAKLHRLAKTVGTATEEGIRGAGFDLVPDPTTRFPNHHRLIHPEGIAGFDDDGLGRLSQAFTDSSPEESP